MDIRRPQEHIFEDRSGYQLGDAFAIHEWILESLSKDYGEDFFVRPVEKGALTGHDFYIQLKGTDNVEQYRLKRSKNFSYPISLANLRQWRRFAYPVIVILWDIDKQLGYWLHVQPFISQKLESDPNWLENPKNSKKPTGYIRIPTTAIVHHDSIAALSQLISSEHGRLRKQLSETLLPTDVVLNDHPDADLPTRIRDQLNIAQLQAAAYKEPTNSKIWWELATAYYQVEDLDNALKFINKAWELEPEHRANQEARAAILAEYAKKNNCPPNMLLEAISLFKGLEDYNPALQHFNIGNCLDGLNRIEEAIERYDKAFALSPAAELAAQIWTNLGNAHSQLGDIEAAASSYENAIQFDPTLWVAYIAYGNLQARRKNFFATCDLFERGISHNPSLVDEGDQILYWYSKALYLVSELTKSKYRIDQLLSANPVHPDGLRAKEIILHDLRRNDELESFDEAIAFFQKRIIDAPQNFFALSELNHLYRQQNDIVNQRKLLENTLKLDTPPDWVYYHYGTILEAEDSFPEALSYFEQANDQQENYAACCAVADVALEIKNYDKAIKYYERLLKFVDDQLFKPEYILEKLAECYYHQNQYERCLYVIVRAIVEFGSTNEWFWINLDVILERFAIELSDFKRDVLSDLNDHQPITESFVREKLEKLSQ